MTHQNHLELGLRKAYARQGHRRHRHPWEGKSDDSGHVGRLEDMVDDPEEFVVRSTEEAEKLKADATWLLDQLRPFE